MYQYVYGQMYDRFMGGRIVTGLADSDDGVICTFASGEIQGGVCKGVG
jgi:hypothetical protein